MGDAVISLQNISKYYKLYKSNKERLKELLNPFGTTYHNKYYALKDIDLNIRKGEILGIVGENGSGKSTLLKLISSVLVPNDGQITVDGKVSALLELGAGLNPEFTGLENIRFYTTVMGLDEKDLYNRLEEIVEFADLGDYINQPLKSYSSGMKARLGFAVAINVEPEILIIDEVLAVGDEAFRRKCYLKMQQFFSAGKTVIYVSHDLTSVIDICSRVILLYKGRLVLDGKAKIVAAYYRKLINTKEPGKETILKEISQLSNGESFINDIKENNNYDSEFYQEIKNLTKVVHSKYNVESYGHKLLTTEGNIVNHLITGNEYIFEYKVKFTEDVGSVNFGFGISNERGAELTWMYYPGLRSHIDINELNSSIITVKCHFKCLFTSGIYYMISTVRNDREELVSQIRDSLVFRVNDLGYRQVSGILNCDSRIDISGAQYEVSNNNIIK